MALTKLTKNLIDGNFGTEWVSTIQTSNFTAEAAKGYFVNTTSQVLYVNLPVGVVGAEIVIQDYAGTFATNKVILTANGSEKIQGVTTGGEITTNNATATLIYQDATRGWTSQDVSLVSLLVATTYLVVAGGGGGGGAGGGGGGGLLTGTHNFSKATNYLLTLGNGGAGATNGNDIKGTNGSNVSLASIAIAIGGGGGGAYGYNVTGSQDGLAGGSGGGGGFRAGVQAQGGAALPAGNAQGKVGGTTNDVASNPYNSSGGGGAGAPGSSDSGVSSGNGGIGIASSINGTNYYFAGGGGGGAQGSSTYSGNGGNGGGGGGANYSSSARAGTGGSGLNSGGNGSGPDVSSIGGAGGANTGGGGGGMGVSVQQGGAGGSGIIILRYPSSYTISGLSGTTTTVGTDKVTTFLTGTGNIQFNDN